ADTLGGLRRDGIAVDINDLAARTLDRRRKAFGQSDRIARRYDREDVIGLPHELLVGRNRDGACLLGPRCTPGRAAGKLGYDGCAALLHPPCGRRAHFAHGDDANRHAHAEHPCFFAMIHPIVAPAPSPCLRGTMIFRSGTPAVDRYIAEGYETVRGMSS